MFEDLSLTASMRAVLEQQRENFTLRNFNYVTIQLCNSYFHRLYRVQYIGCLCRVDHFYSYVFMSVNHGHGYNEGIERKKASCPSEVLHGSC